MIVQNDRLQLRMTNFLSNRSLRLKMVKQAVIRKTAKKTNHGGHPFSHQKLIIFRDFPEKKVLAIY